MLEKVNMNQIMQSAVGTAKSVEYTGDQLPVSKDQLVKIAGSKKSKKQRKISKEQREEFEREVEALLAQE